MDKFDTISPVVIDILKVAYGDLEVPLNNTLSLVCSLSILAANT